MYYTYKQYCMTKTVHFKQTNNEIMRQYIYWNESPRTTDQKRKKLISNKNKRTILKQINKKQMKATVKLIKTTNRNKKKYSNGNFVDKYVWE